MSTIVSNFAQFQYFFAHLRSRYVQSPFVSRDAPRGVF